MVDSFSELEIFLKEYERATNTHDFSNVRSLISTDAIYFFSEKTLNGINEIEKAFIETWDKIQNETYEIKNIKWVGFNENIASCIYEFHWSGIVEGQEKSGKGRGTNIIIKRDQKWVMIHEHLSVQ